MQPALEAKPHDVIMQFGHNDCPGKDSDRETDPATTCRDNLARECTEAHAACPGPCRPRSTHPA